MSRKAETGNKVATPDRIRKSRVPSQMTKASRPTRREPPPLSALPKTQTTLLVEAEPPLSQGVVGNLEPIILVPEGVIAG